MSHYTRRRGPDTPKRERIPMALVPVSDVRIVCIYCILPAVVLLPPALAASQVDGMNAVCHPLLGGCNHGFEVEPADVLRIRLAEREQEERAASAHWSVKVAQEVFDGIAAGTICPTGWQGICVCEPPCRGAVQ